MVFTVSYDTVRQKSSGVRRGGKNALQHNNGMHPTGESANVRRKVECLSQCFPAGDAGRYAASRKVGLMKIGVQISVIYTDEHLIELQVVASNGVFVGQSDVYADAKALVEFAGVLRGFPESRGDTREFELGSFDTEYAGGGAGFRFFFLDSVGHASAEVRLRSDPKVNGGVSDTVLLHIPVEAAAIDSFVVQLNRMAAEVGQSAFLGAAA